jgi:hypothetical protein
MSDTQVINNQHIKCMDFLAPTNPHPGVAIQPNIFPAAHYQHTNIQKSSKAKQWSDPKFPRRWKSIYGFQGSAAVTGKLWWSATWKSPEKLFKTADYSVLESGIGHNDIRQGALSDCYYLATVAALAEWPELLRR